MTQLKAEPTEKREKIKMQITQEQTRELSNLICEMMRPFTPGETTAAEVPALQKLAGEAQGILVQIEMMERSQAAKVYDDKCFTISNVIRAMRGEHDAALIWYLQRKIDDLIEVLSNQHSQDADREVAQRKFNALRADLGTNQDLRFTAA